MKRCFTGTERKRVNGTRTRPIKIEKEQKRVWLLLLLFGATVLCASQGFSITEAVFETTSAISTVGMTTGITRDLNLLSKLVIIFLMYCGRVGSISFAVSLFERKKPPVSYPEEAVTVG